MLQVVVPISPEGWDEQKQEFVEPKTVTLRLEHSLVSLSKWESKWCKPYLTKDNKTFEETVDYIKCMTLTQNVDPDVYNHLTKQNIDAINEYIQAPMTATTFSNDQSSGGKKEITTSELIYYWMVSLNIPFECQKWHLNRLMTLIRVANIKNSPDKKMPQAETMRRNAELNAARRAKLNSRG
jgi:hypothetical protein